MTDDLESIDTLLTLALKADPGWVREVGTGPEAVAMAADKALDVATELVSRLVDLRTVALAQVLKTSSLRAVEARTAINRSTIAKSNRNWDPARTSFSHLVSEEAWTT